MKNHNQPFCPFISENHEFLGTIKDISTFINIDLGNVRTVNIENNPYFFMRDVCDILEIHSTSVITDAKNNFNRMDPPFGFTELGGNIENDKDPWSHFMGVGVSNNYMPYYYMIDIEVQTGVKVDGSPALQTVKTMVISEPALYYFIMRSNKPKAVQFQNWVYNEVLPKMRNAPAASEEVFDAIAEFRESVTNISTNINNIANMNSQLNAQLGYSNGYAQATVETANKFAIGQQSMISDLINSNLALVNTLNGLDERLEKVYNLGYMQGSKK